MLRLIPFRCSGPALRGRTWSALAAAGGLRLLFVSALACADTAAVRPNARPVPAAPATARATGPAAPAPVGSTGSAASAAARATQREVRPLLATVSGRVVDADGQPVAGVEVDVPEARARALTGPDGTFEIAVPPGSVHWVLRRTGFEPFAADRSPQAGERLEFQLKARTLRTPPVVVQGARRAPRPPAPQPGHYGLDAEKLSQQIANFEDVVRGVHALPGVGTASDVHGDFSVRGSAAHANSIWFDGVEIFFPYHLIGFNSIFNPGLLESAEFWSGGAPAEYGDATGGVLSIKSRGLLPPREHAALGLSYLSAQARAGWGTAGSGGALSLRRSYQDKLLDLVGSPVGREIPSFYDLFLRLHQQIGSRHLVSATFLQAGDGVDLASPEVRAEDLDFIATDDQSRAQVLRALASRDRLEIGNELTLGAAYWRMLTSSRSYLETTVAYVPQSFRFALRGDNRESVDIRSAVTTVRQDWTWRGDRHRVRAGWLGYRDDTLRRVSAWSGILELRESNAAINLHDLKERYEIDAARRRDFAAVHLQDEWLVRARTTLGVGARLEYDGLTQEILPSPRVFVEHRPSPRFTARGTWGWVHALRDKPMEVLPTASGLPVHAEHSSETTLGLSAALVPAFATGITAFLKQSTGLVYQSAPAQYANGGIGQSRGLEVWGRWAPAGRALRAGFAGTWSQTRQRDPLAWRRMADYHAQTLDEFWHPVYETPGWYRPAQDEPLRVSVDADFRLGRWHVGSRFQVASGRPYTPVVAVASDPLNTKYGIVGEKGSARYPLYRRLDMRLQREFQTGRAAWSVYADVLNVTAADNVYQVRYNPAYTARYVVRMLPTLPTLGVEARF